MVSKYSCNNCDKEYSSKKSFNEHSKRCNAPVINQTTINLNVSIDGVSGKDNNGNLSLNKTITIPSKCDGATCSCSVSRRVLEVYEKNPEDINVVSNLMWLFLNTEKYTEENSWIYFQNNKWINNIPGVDFNTVDDMMSLIEKVYTRNLEVIQEETECFTALTMLITFFKQIRESKKQFENNLEIYSHLIFSSINKVSPILMDLFRL
jgi:hypothetical protein